MHIDRTCAPVEEVCAKLVKAKETTKPMPLAFIGPKGSRKTTTLNEVCQTLKDKGYSVMYIDARMPDPDAFKKGAEIYFVDNAQKLSERPYEREHKQLIAFLNEECKPILASYITERRQFHGRFPFGTPSPCILHTIHRL